MKAWSSRLILIVAIVGVVAVASLPDAQQRRAGGQTSPNCVDGFQGLFEQIVGELLSTGEIDAVLALRQEEKLARDVYLYFQSEWQLPIFANIGQAEQHHMDQVLRVINIYGLTDPITSDDRCTFDDPALADYCTELQSRGENMGPDFLVEALRVGVEIEDMNLAHLMTLNEDTENPHLDMLTYNLAKASRNHLRAFYWALDAQDGTYTPMYLDEDLFMDIVNTEMERRVFYNSEGELVPACTAAFHGFGMRRGPDHGGQGNGGGGDGGGGGNGGGGGDGGGGGGGNGGGGGDGGGGGGGNGGGGGDGGGGGGGNGGGGGGGGGN